MKKPVMLTYDVFYDKLLDLKMKTFYTETKDDTLLFLDKLIKTTMIEDLCQSLHTLKAINDDNDFLLTYAKTYIKTLITNTYHEMSTALGEENKVITTRRYRIALEFKKELL